MRALVLLMLAVLVAGCLAAPKAPAGVAGPLYAQDCTIRTADWPDACTARASHSEGPKEEIMLAANPKDAGNVVLGAKDLNPDSSSHCVWNGVFVTKDAGASWKDVTIGGTFASRDPTSPFYGYACNTDPDLAFAKDGSLYYLVEMYNFGADGAAGPTGANQYQLGWKFVLARSDDGGLTWPSALALDASAGVVAVLDYSRMTVSPKTGTVVSGWSTFNDASAYQGAPPYSGITMVATHAKGTQADPPQLVFPQQPSAPNVAIGDVAAAPDGSFTLAMIENSYDAPTSVWISRSTDDGTTWSAPAKSFGFHTMGRYVNHTRFRTGSSVELAYAPDGTLFATYAGNETKNSDIFVRSSRDNGATWSPAVRVNSDRQDHAQWHPNVVVSDDGIMHLVFFDRAYDPGDRLLDLTYAESADGGATWATKRVTSMSFDGDLGKHQFGFPFIGDYLGIDANAGGVWLGFPDTVTGTAIVAAARFVRE